MRLRAIDIETTGLEPPAARIVEIGWCDVVSETGEPGTWVVEAEHHSAFVNPGIPIPPEISAIHHIIDADVASALPLEQLGPIICGPTTAIDGLVAHQAKFERSFIADEMTGGLPWVCTYRCALRLWKDAPSHSNQALRYWRNPAGLDRQLAMVAHRAGPDAYVTAHHVRDMLNGGAKLEHLVARSNQPAMLINCHVGKYHGKKWTEVDSGFLRWMLDKDFGEDEMFTARQLLKQREGNAQ